MNRFQLFSVLHCGESLVFRRVRSSNIIISFIGLFPLPGLVRIYPEVYLTVKLVKLDTVYPATDEMVYIYESCSVCRTLVGVGRFSMELRVSNIDKFHCISYCEPFTFLNLICCYDGYIVYFSYLEKVFRLIYVQQNGT